MLQGIIVQGNSSDSIPDSKDTANRLPACNGNLEYLEPCISQALSPALSIVRPDSVILVY